MKQMKALNILIVSIITLISMGFTAYADIEKDIFVDEISVDSILKDLKETRKNLPGNIERAHQTAKRVSGQCLVLGVDSLIAKSNFNLAMVYYFKGYHRVSARYYREALECRYAKENITFRMNCRNNLGINYDILQEFENSLKYYRRSLASAKTIGDSSEIYEVYINIGLAYGNLDSTEKAEHFTKKALRFFEKAADKKNMALCLQNLAKFQFNKQNYHTALPLNRRTLKLFQELEDDYMTAQTYHNISIFLTKLKKETESNRYIDTAFALINDFGVPNIEARFDLTKAYNYRTLNNFSKAEELLLKIIPVFIEFEDYERTKMAYLNLMLLYDDMNNAKLHDAYWKKYDSISNVISRRKISKAIEENMIIKEIDKNFAAVKKQKEKIAENERNILILIIILVVLSAGTIGILMLYRSLRRSYKALYEKNQKENLTNPVVCPAKDDDERLKELYRQIVELFEAEELYKNSEITLPGLAEKLGTNEKYISQAVNKYSDTNFNGFVNKYRIEEAKRLLADPAFSHYSIESVSNKCGFSRRITFTRVFKSMTELSPTAYKKMAETKYKKSA